jgi:putative ABC transport system permease protein
MDDKRERDLHDEVQSHLRMAKRDRMERGEGSREAAAGAQREFGNVAQVQEVTREMWRRRWLSDLGRDLRYTFRTLARNRGFATVAVLTMALGIGANTAVFTVVQSVLLRPLPYPEPERLVWIHDGMRMNDRAGWPACMADFLLWKARSRSFQSLAAMAYNRVALTGDGEAEQIDGAGVSAGFFELLGARPIAGRTFAADEDQPGRTLTAVISERLWKRRYGADPKTIGRTILLNGRPHTVIGIMPSSFEFRQRNAEVWGILTLNPPNRRGPFFLRGVGRLKQGVSLEAARAELDALGQEVERADPKGLEHARYPVFPLLDDMVSNVRLLLTVLTVAVTLVLLIAILNVANLMLARASARRREVAIRLSVGAGRGHLIRQMLTESIVLACAGGALGLLLARAGVEALKAAGPEGLPRLSELAIDGRVLWYTLVVTVLSGVMFGLGPALGSGRYRLSEALVGGGRTGETRGRQRVRASLVALEVALSVMLLAGAGLLIRSFTALGRVPTGVATPPERLLAMSISPASAPYREPERLRAYWDQLLERVRQTPGVESAALTLTLPPDRVGFYDGFEIAGRTPPDGGPNVPVPYVTTDYFQTLGIPLLRGRNFNAGDTANSPRVTIVSETLAKRYFPGEDPVGRLLKHGGPGLKNTPMEIIGVVGDVQYDGPAAKAAPVYYEAASQSSMRPMWLVLRTRGDAASVLRPVREAIRGLDPDVPVHNPGTMAELQREAVALPRFRSTVMAIFAAAALLLAGIGIYGLVAYSVAQRTAEIGIRMALGAPAGSVLRQVVAQGALMATIGVAAGTGGALMLAGNLRTLLFGVSARDAASFAGAAGALVLVAILASYVPARRAARIDPLLALKQE